MCTTEQDQATGSSLPLTALQHPIVSTVLNTHHQQLRELAVGLGSPLHIVFPEIFRHNIIDFQQVFITHRLNGRIFYAKKANKARAFATSCAQSGIGIDVASLGELAHSLASGVIGNQIGISGPEKDDALLTLGLRHGCLITIDSLSELHRITAISSAIAQPAHILLRIRPDIQPDSRFGLTHTERIDAVIFCANNSQRIILEGFAFHLNGYCIQQRAIVANELMDYCRDAIAQGLSSCTTVNMGGGLPVQYVATQQWTDFLTHDNTKHYHAQRSLSGYYPYGSPTTSHAALDNILHYCVEPQTTLADKARTHNIDFIIEPGRALLHHAGFTLFEVQGIKPGTSTDNDVIITVRGSNFSLSEQWFNSDYLPEPILLPSSSDTESSAHSNFRGCVAGSTCLESDMITWRKITFNRAVQRGDYMVYLNTAGYQMDSNESTFHNMPIPHKVVIDVVDIADINDTTAERVLRWYLDSNSV